MREDVDPEHTVRSTFAHDWSQEIQDRVLSRWQEYGYPPARGRSDDAGLAPRHVEVERP
jgi:hypothetical protein